MDYYEELGLKPSATVQEIRQAYKVLARLVHPDGQANQPLREMAERQMKRLNQILATLTDEPARREYDTGLETANRQPPAAVAVSDPNWRQPKARVVWLPGWLRPVVENWFWISLALVVAGVGTWYLAQVHAENRAPAAAKVAPVPEDKAAAAVARRPSVREPKPVRHPPATSSARQKPTPPPPARTANAPEASAEELRVTAKPLEPRPQETLPLAAAAPAPASPPAAADSGPAAAAKPRGSPFAGNWLYVPDPNENSRPGVYPAKYVELLMGEEHGLLRGTYRAEYQILDRAVSPEVTFELAGDTPPGTAAHLKWTASDGAKGDADLALDGPNVLKITWWTTEFGRHSKLASGASKLIRQQAP